MLFFPYTVDLHLEKVPWLTIGVSLLCLVVYVAQSNSTNTFAEAAEKFCSEPQPRMFEIGVQQVTGSVGIEPCQEVLWEVYFSERPETKIQELLADAPPMAGLDREQTQAHLFNAIERQFQQYRAEAPVELTQQLWFVPSTFDPWRMITSSFAHADWEHVLFNVLFYFAFAATVEVCVGWAPYIMIVLGASLFIGYADALMSLAAGDDVPTLGLSGVVMTMMTLLAFLLPRARVRCFLWFFVLVRTVPIPVWLLACWYVAGDVYRVLGEDEGSQVNFVAHVAGAAFGFLIGAIFLQQRKTEVRLLARAAGVYG